MIIEQGQRFSYILPNGDEGRIEITSAIGNQVAFKQIHGKSGSDSINEDTFKQLVNNGYFKKR
ncbi:hypothetical protein [Salinicoccus roseus]|uniref:Uncharacterized protein n=1 Tax=Salinicoccus roseus TaxID=45670 RepID=A0A265E6A9_9STAP|nr:hypothetical protein [Salinicoccus roseus]OZT77137.1 hypothetical protein CFN03_08665 [Salinicoccus roseus]